jgi:hypothetical protein
MKRNKKQIKRGEKELGKEGGRIEQAYKRNNKNEYS